MYLRKKVPPGEKCPSLFSRGVGGWNETIEVDGIRPVWRGV
jgi:hypothetical protein